MFQFRWLRLFIRRRTKPIPEKTAADWKKRLALGYMFLAWNACGFVCYMMYTGRADWPKYYGYKKEEGEEVSPGVYWAKTLGKGEAKIIRISGLQVVGEDTFKKENAEEVVTSNGNPSSE